MTSKPNPADEALHVAVRQAATILNSRADGAGVAQVAMILRAALEQHPNDALKPGGGRAPACIDLRETDLQVLSNFSAFSLYWAGGRFDTSMAAYLWEQFPNWPQIASAIAGAFSPYAAFRIATENRELRRADWPEVREGIMREILRAKADQHPVVRARLLASDDSELVGGIVEEAIGPLWMEVRDEIRTLDEILAREEGEPLTGDTVCAGRK